MEHNYLGYAVHWPTGIPVTDQHTEIEMGAEESEGWKVWWNRQRAGLEASGGADEEVGKGVRGIRWRKSLKVHDSIVVV